LCRDTSLFKTQSAQICPAISKSYPARQDCNLLVAKTLLCLNHESLPSASLKRLGTKRRSKVTEFTTLGIQRKINRATLPRGFSVWLVSSRTYAVCVASIFDVRGEYFASAGACMKPISQEPLGSDTTALPAGTQVGQRELKSLTHTPLDVWLHRNDHATSAESEYKKVIDNICNLPWECISNGDVLRIAKVYYYFSVQFRENLEIACRLYPNDDHLKILYREECNTSNLSPWENVAEAGEAMNHDEFMRRLLTLHAMGDMSSLESAGAHYLARVHQIPDHVRVKSIASYEDGGLTRVFSAMLRAPSWRRAGSQAFRHFLEKHIEFDSCVNNGHGALSRHLSADDSISPLWAAFEDMLRCAVPAFTMTKVDNSVKRICAPVELLGQHEKGEAQLR
jgi:hypothetical protein